MQPPVGGPHIWPGLEGSAGGVCDCRPHEAAPGAGPGRRRRGIRTSCAGQMFLVYPQMCVAAHGCPGLRVPAPGWGRALGPPKEGHIFAAAEFASHFKEPLSLALREASSPAPPGASVSPSAVAPASCEVRSSHVCLWNVSHVLVLVRGGPWEQELYLEGQHRLPPCDGGSRIPWAGARPRCPEKGRRALLPHPQPESSHLATVCHSLGMAQPPAWPWGPHRRSQVPCSHLDPPCPALLPLGVWGSP